MLCMSRSSYSRVRTASGALLVLIAVVAVVFNLTEARLEDKAAKEAQQALELSLNLAGRSENSSDPAVSDSSLPAVSTSIPKYSEGEALGVITSEEGELDVVVVMGTSESSLSKGPGVFYGGALPGQRGNTSIAGHRTSHGAPFRDIDKLSVGEGITIKTEYGDFRYRVTGSEIINPKEVRVLSDKSGADLTLIACHPLNSTKQRIVVTAKMEVVK
jgi:LPXTG-site transpeptidase (sortase) family protein